VIGEAAVRLGREAPLIVADVPWRQIRDLGNLLRHAYDKVDLEIIWHTITDDLPPLKSAVLKALQSTGVRDVLADSKLVEAGESNDTRVVKTYNLQIPPFR